MSLVLVWVGGDYIAAAGDGKAILKHPDGRITLADEHCHKLHRTLNESQLSDLLYQDGVVPAPHFGAYPYRHRKR